MSWLFLVVQSKSLRLWDLTFKVIEEQGGSRERDMEGGSKLELSGWS